MEHVIAFDASSELATCVTLASLEEKGKAAGDKHPENLAGHESSPRP